MAVSVTPAPIAGALRLGIANEEVRSPSLVRLAVFERWFLRAGAFLLPLSYWWFTYDHYVLPKLLVARVLVLGLAALFIARTALAGRLQIKRTPLDLPLLALIASAVLSAALGVNLNVSVFGTYARYDGVLTLSTYAALYWLATQSIAGRDEARSLLRILVASGSVVAAIATMQWVLGDFLGGALVIRAYGTMGNPNVLGAFLALLIPVAFGEVVAAKTALARVLAGNALALMALALLLSESRSSWIALAVAGAIAAVVGRVRPRYLLIGLGAAVVAGAAVVLAAPSLLGSDTLAGVTSLHSLWQRFSVWQDTLNLIASRPLIGYGPDTFGLVYPQFQSGNWASYVQFDKAHSDLVQVAATQGLVGVGAYLWLLLAFMRAFWRGRMAPGASSLFTGWVAYQLTVQVNFTALAAAFPYWIFVSAALALWSRADTSPARARPLHWPLRVALGSGLLVVGALAGPGVGMAYVADENLRQAVEADIAGSAAAIGYAASARTDGPRESVYAVEVGNVAFEGQRWEAAREAYGSAARLGTFNPEMYRNLALADRNLGLTEESIAAARTAVYLDRFDPANQAILAQMQASGQ